MTSPQRIGILQPAGSTQDRLFLYASISGRKNPNPNERTSPRVALIVNPSCKSETNVTPGQGFFLPRLSVIPLRRGYEDVGYYHSFTSL